MNAAEPELRKLVELELEAANRENPPFHSAHEGFAVILEEVEEARAELDNLDLQIVRLWGSVRSNQVAAMGDIVCDIENHAGHLAAEALQVAAMARKFRQMGGSDDDA